MSVAWVAAGVAAVGAISQADSSRKAGNQQKDATNASLSEQRRQYDQTREDYAPYRAAGTNALTQLQGDIDKPTTAADVMQDPGYHFGLDQGQQAIDRKVAAMGGRVSGAAIKSAARFGVNTATAGYGAAYQRKQDRLNRLTIIAGIGQVSTAGGAAFGQRTADNVSGAISSQGDANAAGTMGRGRLWAETGNQLAAMYGRSKAGGGNVYTPGGANNYTDGGAGYDAYDFGG